MASRKNNICIIFMATILMASSSPIPNLKDQNLPWDHPCMPNQQPTKVKENYVSTDFDIINLSGKVETTQILADNLLETLEERLADSRVIESLQKTPVIGFPEVDKSDKQQDASIYLDHFSHLSKAAVFFEQMKHDEGDEELQYGFEDLSTENLSQMCEIHVALTNQNIQLPNPVPRSVMPTELRNLKTRYEHYKRNYQIMYRYKILLKYHLAQYQDIRANTPKPPVV